MSETGFQQAQIPVQKVQEFEQLKAAIARVFSPEKVENFLCGLDKANVRVRDFERVVEERLIEQADPQLKAAAKQLYSALAVSDQGLIREFYLASLEKVDAAMRARFNKLYRYY
jgi:hypothetical protein